MGRVSSPLGIECGVRDERVDRAIGVVGAGAIRSGCPVTEAVATAGEGVGRQGRRDVGGLVTHRARAAVGVKDHGEATKRSPLGSQRNVAGAHGVGGACRVGVGAVIPASKGEAGAREGVRCHDEGSALGNVCLGRRACPCRRHWRRSRCGLEWLSTGRSA